MTQGRFGMFQRPGQRMWNMHAIAPGLDHRQHIGFQRIADHHRLCRRNAMPGEQALIDFGPLVRHDFDGVEQITQPRLCKLAFLIQQIPLRDQHHTMILRGPCHGLTGVGQKVDRMFQHLAPGGHDLGDHRRRHPALGHLDGGFDHREHEAFDAKAIVANVAPFGGDQALPPWLLSGVAIAVCIGLFIWLRRTDRPLTGWGIGLVMGGAIGNVIDRARWGAVRQERETCQEPVLSFTITQLPPLRTNSSRLPLLTLRVSAL